MLTLGKILLGIVKLATTSGIVLQHAKCKQRLKKHSKKTSNQLKID